MALVPTINVCVKTACSVLTFKETTGVYNVTTNTGGYGSPNPLTTGPWTSVILTVIPPDGISYNIDLSTHGFPSNNQDFEYTIPMSDIGNRTKIEDGYWQFVYTIVLTSGTVTYIASKTALFTCNSNCCVNSMLLDISIDNSSAYGDANNKKINEYVKAKAFLDSLKYYAFCGNTEKFDNIKLIIDKICAKSNCKSCN